ncbi:acyl dehydratase [Rhodobacteraceae bacterium CCMM004]|nr:acyl dehydratase [Rhodobacteraceae bacterium CCMM004]
MTPPVTIPDVLDPARAAALHATLGRAGPPPEAGDPLPPFYHHVYFWDARPPAALGRDGHPQPGGDGAVPQTGLPRRMWAGGRLTFHAPLVAGRAAEKTTRADPPVRKEGRSGPLVFVTLHHALRQGGTLCVEEAQDLVYRTDPDPGAPAPVPVPPRAPEEADWQVDRRFDTTTLFRYSALTFNGHRIHYDLDYARRVEGYGGLVVHGPLLAQLLVLEAEARLGPLSAFRFRAMAPLLHSEAATLAGRGADLWAAGPDARLLMQAEAE